MGDEPDVHENDCDGIAYDIHDGKAGDDNARMRAHDDNVDAHDALADPAENALQVRPDLAAKIAAAAG